MIDDPDSAGSRGEPVYTIGTAARLLDVCAATLRIWEKKQLLTPVRLGKNRFYSRRDMERLEMIKHLLQKKRLNIEGVKAVLDMDHCWEIRQCSAEDRDVCPVYLYAGRT
ncbi:MAG: hypothetical protein A2X36_00525 [Elusimicrobia bacterium GWA2_69_24]|nr:MAG: hypothetical protein A2X36_00525 [Elusimicrobia bacterium GWA2_69_24]HBL16965.1 hypothetical protein [Elusimicrobiota bacterium]